MIRIIAATLVIVLAVAGCVRKAPVKGSIFERKELAGDKLLIKYQYTYNNKTYRDSASIMNHVLGTDSIELIVDPSKPQKSAPVFANE